MRIASRVFYQFSRDVYPSISPSPLYSRRYISRGLFPMKRNGHLKRASEKRSGPRLVRGRGGDLGLIKFLLLTRVILKCMNFTETTGQSIISMPSRMPSYTWSSREFYSAVYQLTIYASAILSRTPSTRSSSCTTLASIMYPSSAVFFTTFGTSCTERSEGEGFRGMKSIIRLHSNRRHHRCCRRRRCRCPYGLAGCVGPFAPDLTT